MEFLTPHAALIALAGFVPLATALAVQRRNARARRLLGLPDPGRAARLELPVAIAVLTGILGLAAAQPVLHTERTRLTRLDAEAFVAMDTSRSMLASASARSPTRLDRARRIALRIRAAIPDVPTGIGTFTDRPLPLLLPTSDGEAFAASVQKAIGIERPPPLGSGLTVSSFDAIAPIPTSGYYTPGTKRKLLVVITDAESEGFSVVTLHRDFGPPPKTAVVVVRVGGGGERVYGPDGLPESAYIPPPATGRQLGTFLEATHGRAFGEATVPGAEDAARAALGAGPTAKLDTSSGRRELAPWLVLVAIVPLGAVLLRRNLWRPRQSITMPTVTFQTRPFRKVKSVMWAPGRNFPR